MVRTNGNRPAFLIVGDDTRFSLANTQFTDATSSEATVSFIATSTTSSRITNPRIIFYNTWFYDIGQRSELPIPNGAVLRLIYSITNSFNDPEDNLVLNSYYSLYRNNFNSESSGGAITVLQLRNGGGNNLATQPVIGIYRSQFINNTADPRPNFALGGGALAVDASNVRDRVRPNVDISKTLFRDNSVSIGGGGASFKVRVCVIMRVSMLLPVLNLLSC